MALRYFGVFVATVVGLAVSRPALAADNACWQLIDSALQRSAHSPHSKFISYGERITVYADGHTLQNIGSSVVYRDDGIAYITDDRWVHPFFSAAPEPGPPVLGPYWKDRTAWLDFGDVRAPYPVIADVHAFPRESCSYAGMDAIDGQRLEHLVVGHEQQQHKHAGLREIWIDPLFYDIVRVVVRGPLRLYVKDEIKEDLADYRVDVERVGRFTVVKRVTWQYREREYGQWTDLSAEYDFRDYSFFEVAPPGTFPLTIAV